MRYGINILFNKLHTMKSLFFVIVFLTLSQNIFAQKDEVFIYRDSRYNGESKSVKIGSLRFFTKSDFNDDISSLKIPQGLLVLLYEHANDKGGYGRMVMLSGNIENLEQIGFNDMASYIVVKKVKSAQPKPLSMLNRKQIGRLEKAPSSRFTSKNDVMEEFVLSENGQVYAPSDEDNYILQETWDGSSIQKRKISDAEYAFAKTIFKKDFPDKEKITVTNLVSPFSGTPYVRPTTGKLLGGGYIRMNMGKYFENPLKDNNSKTTFAHELTHVWQIEHFGLLKYISEFLDNHLISPLLNDDANSDAYDYICDEWAKLSDYNFEQQGNIVEAYFNKIPCETKLAKAALEYINFDIVYSSFTKQNGNWNNLDNTRTVADVNGDGKADIVGFGTKGVYVAFSTGNGFSDGQLLLSGSFHPGDGWRNNRNVRTMGDVNGDGKADVVGFGTKGVYVAFSTGNGFTDGQLLLKGSFCNEDGWEVNKNPRLMADVNGDGKDDIIGFGTKGVYVAFSTGNGFAPDQLILSGKFCRTDGWERGNMVRTVADVNGDGKSDIVGFGEQGVFVALSTGNSFADMKLLYENGFNPKQGWNNSMHVRTLGDINGDKKSDIVGFGINGVIIAKSNGGGFNKISLTIREFGSNQGGWNNASHVRTIGDVNGDGKSDLVCFGDRSVFVVYLY